MLIASTDNELHRSPGLRVFPRSGCPRAPRAQDRFSTSLWVGLVPDRDITLNQLFSFVHDKLLLIVALRRDRQHHELDCALKTYRGR